MCTGILRWLVFTENVLLFLTVTDYRTARRSGLCVRMHMAIVMPRTSSRNALSWLLSRLWLDLFVRWQSLQLVRWSGWTFSSLNWLTAIRYTHQDFSLRYFWQRLIRKIWKHDATLRTFLCISKLSKFLRVINLRYPEFHIAISKQILMITTAITRYWQYRICLLEVIKSRTIN